MQSAILYDQALQALKTARRVLVVAHRKPDADSLGSASAVLHYCLSAGISAAGFCVDVPSVQYSFIKEYPLFATDQAVFAADVAPDLIAVFDAGDLRHAGIADLVAGMKVKPTILNFDHHATNERFGAVNVLDLKASSTAEVVYDFLEFCGAEFDKHLSTALLSGILTDTGMFTNAATTVRSLEIASRLMLSGANMPRIAAVLLKNTSIDALRFWGAAFSRLKHHAELGVASTAIFLEDGLLAFEDQLELIVNFMGKVLDVDVVLLLKETVDGKVKASFRTVLERDLGAIARRMGGGGHDKAAGVTVPGKITETEFGWVVAQD